MQEPKNRKIQKMQNCTLEYITQVDSCLRALLAAKTPYILFGSRQNENSCAAIVLFMGDKGTDWVFT